MSKLLSAVLGSVAALLADKVHDLALPDASPHGPWRIVSVNGVPTIARWTPGSTVTFRFSANLGAPATYPPNIIAGSDVRTAVNAAAAAWTAAGNIGYAEGPLATQTAAAQDNVSLITFSDPTVPAGAIADAQFWFNLLTGTITEADIRFSMAFQHDSTLTSPTAFDIQSIATHEFGHAFGLDHSAVIGATMFPFAAPQTTRFRSLSQDDVAGINLLYPTVPFFNATGAISGVITQAGVPVRAAHVFARDAVTGATVAGVLSDSLGAYTITGLPAGSYVVAAEPIDGPFTPANVLGRLPNPINTSFTVGTPVAVNLPVATVVTANLVATAGAQASIDFVSMVPLGATPPTPLTLPANAARPLASSLNYTLTIQGVGITAATTLTVAGPGVFVSAPTGTGVAGQARYTVSVTPAATPGTHDIVVSNGPGAGVTYYCGGFDISDTTPPSAQVIRYGTGCPSTVNNVLLRLNPTGVPALGTTMFLTMLPLAPTETPVLAMSLYTQLGAATPCQMTLIDTAPSALLPAPYGVQVGPQGGTSGQQVWSWPIPVSPALAGTNVNTQAFAYVNGVLSGSSNALRLAIR